MTKDAFEQSFTLENLESSEKKFTIACPEFYMEDTWVTATELFSENLYVTCLHNKFIELGLSKSEMALDISKWKSLPLAQLQEDGVFADPIKYIDGTKFSSPPIGIERRLFAEFFYTGNLPD